MRLWTGNNKKNEETGNHNNRVNLIIAIIFLLGLGIFVRLFNLQVIQYEDYLAKASRQHDVFGILNPGRGRIFIAGDQRGSEDNLYPIVTNKKFASVFAVPKDVKNPQLVADNLYEIFRKEKIIKEAEGEMEKEDAERIKRELEYIEGLDLSPEEKEKNKIDAVAKHEILIKDPTYLEIRSAKKEKIIESRKKEALSEYLEMFNKLNDPYEPLENKIDDDRLKKLYVAIADRESAAINIDDLEISGDSMLIKKDKEESIKICEDTVKINQKKKDKQRCELKIDGLGFAMDEHRFYPENNIGSHLLGFIGSDGEKQSGRYGLEGFFNEELSGVPGSIKTERGAAGDLIIINNREYNKPKNGNDLVLTIDKNIQYYSCQKLNETALRHGADGGSVIVIDPKSGAIMAMCSWPDYDPNNYKEVDNIKVYNNPAIFDQYEPGSVMKVMTMASALDQGKVTPETTYKDEGMVKITGWPKPIKNSDYESNGGHGITDMTTVLQESLNTGAIFAMGKIGANKFVEYLKNFGFGEKTGIELETENAGNISQLLKDKVKEIDAATASFGQGVITVTPLQMVMAYAAVANGGILMKPYLVKEIISQEGQKSATQPHEIRRVISDRTAAILSGMLVNVVEKGHSKRAKVDGYYVAGKTGTAQVASSDKKGYGSKTIHTFIGFAPAEEPRFTMLVKLDDPKGINFAESSAVPLFQEIAAFILNYLEVPKER